MFLLTGLQEVGVGGTPVAHPGKCLTIFVRGTKSVRAPLRWRRLCRPRLSLRWLPGPHRPPRALGLGVCWAVSLGPSGLLGAPRGLGPVHPGWGAPSGVHKARPRRGPTRWASLSLSFHVVISLEPVMTVGWGLFQNILRSVPTRQREVEGEPCSGSQARWPRSHALADPMP